MSFADNMRILSNINCGLASLVSYGEMRSNGVSPYYATMGLFGNMANGITRNEIAYQMQRHGNPIGNTINMYAGYGNPVSNTIGTLGMMSACNPWMFFNCYPCMNYSFTFPMGGFNYCC
jgi:hypothetical protein